MDCVGKFWSNSMVFTWGANEMSYRFRLGLTAGPITRGLVLAFSVLTGVVHALDCSATRVLMYNVSLENRLGSLVGPSGCGCQRLPWCAMCCCRLPVVFVSTLSLY